MRRFASVAALAATILTLAAGCESEVDSRLALAGLGLTCRLNSDCEEQLICAFELCHQACNDNRDCERGALCVRGFRENNVCQLPAEQTCDRERFCPGAQRCDNHGRCRDACVVEGDCLAGQVCAAGFCTDPTEVEDGGLSPGTAACQSGRDCAVNEACRDGRCEPDPVEAGSCLRTSDCANEQVCSDGVCVAAPVLPVLECRYASDCPVEGQKCTQGSCECECQVDADCGAEQACRNGCACQSNRIIHGDVMVTNARELAELDDIDQIDGKFTLMLQSSDTFRVPHLRQAKSVQFDGKEVFPSIVFEALERVTDGFRCDQACAAPRLASAGSVEIHGVSTEELAFPALESVTGQVVVEGSPKLAVVHLEQLASAASLSIYGNQRLKSVELRTLATLSGELLVQNNPQLQALALVALREVASVRLDRLPQLSSLSLSGLEGSATPNEAVPQIGAMSINATALTSLASLNLERALTSGGALTVTFNRALPGCEVDTLRDALLARLPPWSGSYVQHHNAGCP